MTKTIAAAALLGALLATTASAESIPHPSYDGCSMTPVVSDRTGAVLYFNWSAPCAEAIADWNRSNGTGTLTLEDLLGGDDEAAEVEAEAVDADPHA